MKNQKILWAVSVLVLIIVLGLILFRDKGANVKGTAQNNNGAQVVPSNTNEDLPQGAKPSIPSNLTAAETAAIEATSRDSNLGADAQVALATKAAKESGEINVKGCEMSPAILKVLFQKEFTLKNTGTEESVVVFHADDVAHSVPPGGQTVVTADFGKGGEGLFGYYCRSGSNVRQGLVLLYSL